MYRQAPNLDGAIRLADSAFIPYGSPDWAEVQAWLDAGNSLLPAIPLPVPVPAVVTMRQARLALLQSGLLAQVNNSIASMTGTAGDAARIEWEFAATVDRGSQLVQTLTMVLGLTDIQRDELFTLAATL